MAGWAAVPRPQNWLGAGTGWALHGRTVNQAPQAGALETRVGDGQEAGPLFVKPPLILTAWPADGAALPRWGVALQTVELGA